MKKVMNQIQNPKSENITESNDNASDCDTCNENRIYSILKNLREKFSFNDSLEN